MDERARLCDELADKKAASGRVKARSSEEGYWSRVAGRTAARGFKKEDLGRKECRAEQQ